MRITVAEYAKTRNISDATVKAAINRLELQLEQNPNDKRQRLLSLEQQAQLDNAIPKANPSAIPTVPTEVIEYHRPTEVGMTLAKRAVTVPEITYTPTTAIDNPLFQALATKVNAIEVQNAAIAQQVQITITAQRDTEAAIDAYQQMDIIQQATARAHRDHQLDQQAYNQARQNLQMQAAGLTPVVPSSASPSAQPTPPPVAPSEYSKSPF